MALVKSLFMKSMCVPRPAVILIVLSIAFTACTKNQTTFNSSTEQSLVQNTWSVDYYFSSQDLTGNYAASKLLFSSTGDAAFEKNGSVITGNWAWSVDHANHETITLQFNSNDGEITALNKSWKVMNHSDASLQFEQSDGSTDVLFRLKAQ